LTNRIISLLRQKSAVEEDREHLYRGERQKPHVGMKRSVFTTAKKIGIMYIGTKAAAQEAAVAAKKLSPVPCERRRTRLLYNVGIV
jgi:hypothetical protein